MDFNALLYDYALLRRQAIANQGTPEGVSCERRRAARRILLLQVSGTMLDPHGALENGVYRIDRMTAGALEGKISRLGDLVRSGAGAGVDSAD